MGHGFNLWSRKILHPGATKPVHLNCWAYMPRACAPQQEKPQQWEAHALQLESSPTHCNQRMPAHSNEEPVHPKIKQKFLKKNAEKEPLWYKKRKRKYKKVIHKKVYWKFDFEENHKADTHIQL